MKPAKADSPPKRLSVAERYVDELVRPRREISGTLVVGSVASGTDGPHSDIDLRLFNTQMRRDDRPRRDGGRWFRDVYVDVSEVPDAWLGDPAWIAGCPRHGGPFRFGRAVFDREGRVERMLGAVRELYSLPEYHGMRVRLFRNIVDEKINESVNAMPGTSYDLCRSLPFPIIDASVMPAICAGVSPSTIKSMLQMESLDTSLYRVFLAATQPAGIDLAFVRRWLADAELVGAANANVFTNHVLDQVSWLASQGHCAAATHILWALVYFCLERLEGESRENKACEWLRGIGWIGHEEIRAKLEWLHSFLDTSIEKLFPHSIGLVDS